jgi:nucleoside-diphosphate-sugar epimerase
VTGATGFLGGAVARRLHASGHDVLATGRDVGRGGHLAAAGVRFLPVDLASDGSVTDLCRKQDWVVHCAALSSPWGPYQSFRRSNVVATRNLVDAATREGVGRFVHVSTPSIYMGTGSRRDVREDEPLPCPVNAYAATKRDAEIIVEGARLSGLRSILLRPRALFGPGDTTIFPRLLRALESGRLPIIGDGSNEVDLTYIDNAVDAVLLACAAPDAACDRTYNITNGEPVRLWDFIADLAEALGYKPPHRRLPRPVAMAMAGLLEALARVGRSRREPLLTRYSVCVLADTMTLDITRAREYLGYHPGVPMHDGLARFVRAVRSGA